MDKTEAIAAVDKISEGVKKVLHTLLVDFASRSEQMVDENRIVGYWMGRQIRIDIRDTRKAIT